MEPIVNKVAQSGLITLDLQDLLVPKDEIITFDLKPYLYQELLLREKDFRAAMNEYAWEALEGKYLAVICSSDAIIPMWAYMLISAKATPFVKGVHFGSASEYRNQLLLQAIKDMDLATYDDARVVIKGCGDESVSEGAFLQITQQLQPVVKSLMYGEPCSTVPIYKKK